MYNPTISIICALSDNRVIGNKNKIPWHIKDDLIRFKQKTIGHTVIMGRTTFDSMMGYYQRSGRPIPERRHIIVSREQKFLFPTTYPNCYVAQSIDEALQKAKEIEPEEVFISGGASIFKQTIDKADRLYLTLVHGKFVGDTYFPDYSMFTKVLAQEDRSTGDIHYTFLDLSR